MMLPPLNCGSCRACCFGEPVELQPADNPAMYKTKLVDGKRVLAKGKDGNCVYLSKRGCTIHGRAPSRCRAFDCRKYALQIKNDPLKELKMQSTEVAASVAEGERRLAAA
jgi:Fe-S-cluster containining protein